MSTLVSHSHSHSHSHSDSHPHVHGTRQETEQAAVDIEGPEKYGELLFRLLKGALAEKKILNPDELRTGVEKAEKLGQNLEGPRLVARSWVDPSFRELLLKDASKAVESLGMVAQNSTAATVLTAVENTPDVHNLVVCTLCSCYPRSILGLSPSWYRSRSYRSRAIREPRAVLAEFGTILPKDVKVEVHDSTADLRYIVIPMRPKGTSGWSEDDLAKLVSRNSMIGVTPASEPQT
mmetsp:Transcript_40884/g.79614  ORF Transcript_40884/g.79614 Transcript_40884/m.79614 type:complete len:235 (+) Transcript_40884:1028-1732(+)